MIKHDLKEHYPFRKPMELYEVVKNYLEWGHIGLVGRDQYDVDAVRMVAISLWRLHPTWPEPKFADLLGAMQWCVNAEQVRLDKPQEKTKQAKPPNMPSRFRQTLQIHKRALEQAEEQGKVWKIGNDREVYYYCRETIELDENCPGLPYPAVTTWLKYLREGRKIEAAQEQYADEKRTETDV